METFKRFFTRCRTSPATPPAPVALNLRERLYDEIAARVLLAADYRELHTAATWLTRVVTDLDPEEGSDLWWASRNLKGVLKHQIHEI